MRKLDIKDTEKLMRYLNNNPYGNLFIIGDLLLYGFDNDVCCFYGEEQSDEFVAVIMKYRDILHIYTDFQTPEIGEAICDLIKTEKITSINCGEQTYPLLESVFAKLEIEVDECTLAVYEPNNYEIDTAMVTALRSNEVSKLREKQTIIFGEKPFDDVVVAAEIESGERLVYVVKVNDDIVAISTALVFTPDAAMIIGVGTIEEYRNNGYASACVKKLVTDLYKNGRKGVLFYLNPVAAKIYQAIGFQELEKYYMIKVSEKSEEV